MAADKKESKKEEGAVDDAAAEAKRKKKKLFIMIGVGVLLIGISIGATLFAVKLMSPKKASAEEGAASEEHASESSESEHAAPAIYFALKPNFTVNYDVNGRQRFLQTEITLMFKDEAVQKVLETHMPTVRNGLVMLLSNQKFDDLQTTEGKESLRAAALETIQDILSKERSSVPTDGKEEKNKSEKSKKPASNVEQVLFTQFVMQ